MPSFLYSVHDHPTDRDPGTDEPYPARLMGPERLGIACHDPTHTAINNKAGIKTVMVNGGPELGLVSRRLWL